MSGSIPMIAQTIGGMMKQAKARRCPTDPAHICHARRSGCELAAGAYNPLPTASQSARPCCTFREAKENDVPRMISLALLIDQATGNHPASWLHPDTNAAGSTDIGHFRAVAQLAERGRFDLFFVADTPAARTENLHAWSRFP